MLPPRVVPALALIGSLAAYAVQPTSTQHPRVAVVYSDYGNFRHRDDYDGKMRQLGWSLDKIENTGVAKVGAKLTDWDILIGSALFNYSNVVDFSQLKQELLQFVEQGGALVLTDTSYVPHLDWLAKLGPGWGVTHSRCAKTGTPTKWFDRSHALFNADRRIGALGPTWAHMDAERGWGVLARCGDGHPTVLFRTYGRGYVLLSCHWGYSPGRLQNLWGTLRLCRKGVLPTFPDLSRLHLGNNTVKVSATNLGRESRELTFSLRVEPTRGPVETAESRLSLPPGAGREAQLNVRLDKRGRHGLTAAFSLDGREFHSWRPDDVVIPDLLAVHLTNPRYRDAIYLADPPPELTYRITLHPFTEKITDLRVAAALRCGDRTEAQLPQAACSDLVMEQTLPLPALKPGELKLVVSLTSAPDDRLLARVDKSIPVHPVRPNQAAIADDLTLRVGGTPFFPIGIYHIPLKDLPKARDLGFNCFQGWGSTPESAKENLDAAQTHGMKVILEMSSFLRGRLNLEGFTSAVRELRNHPALLAWYTVDEPHGDEQLSWCRQAWQVAREEDPDHPVYLVMCSPNAFATFAGTTDILAVDPYPIPGSVDMVSSWMVQAQEAVRAEKPVWLIPQLHNSSAYRNPGTGRGPTPDEERNMVYQGLVHGAKGIVYYPWDDGPCGLVHDPDLVRAVKSINAELAALGPKLLVAERTPVARKDGARPGLHAAVFRTHAETFAIAVNVTTEPLAAELDTPGLTTGPVRVLFEGREVRADGGSLRDSFAPLAVHVYRWTPPR